MRRFYFSLAEKLGMTVCDLLRRLDSAELTEWMAYYDLQANPPPKPQSAAEVRAGFAALARNSKRKKR